MNQFLNKYLAVLLVCAGAFALVIVVVLIGMGRKLRLLETFRREAAPPDIKFVRIEPGTFVMGDPAETDPNSTDCLHTVTLTRPFLMSAHCVIVKEFAQFVSETGYKTSAEKAGRAQGCTVKGIKWITGRTWQNSWPNQPDSMPVVAVSWFDARAFCQWLGRSTGKKVRLPTEAEWEYACRAGTDTAFESGPIQDFAWLAGNSGDHPFDDHALLQRSKSEYAQRVGAENLRPHPVGLKRPNHWGLYDMHGNVWQWCFDAVGPYPKEAVTDPTGPAIENPEWRRARGGDYFNPPSIATAFNRGYWLPGVGYTNIGFRVVQELPPGR